MKLPISQRLLTCAGFVQPGARVADVGTDHGYLGIYLLRQGIAAHIYASDIREQPLEKARANAARFGTAEHMTFSLSDGLAALSPGEADTVVCAGMGADCIVGLLEAASWVRDGNVRLLLQPQSSGQTLRRWLPEHGFVILRETLLEENRFLYTVLEARWSGNMTTPTPGRQFVTPQLLASGSPLLGYYLGRLIRSMEQTVLGLRQGADDPERLSHYETALAELREMERSL